MNRLSAPHVMPRIGRSGIFFADARKTAPRMRREFDGRHAIRLRGLLERGLLRLIQRGIDRATFYEKAHRDICTESCMRHNASSALLRVLANDRRLFQAVQAITGCGPIGCFIGRVYRMVPGRSHRMRWHDDVERAKGRMIGMSINLSAEVYRGGVFQLRDRRSARVLREVPNTGFGDAVLFRIAADLEHRVTPVVGGAAKTAFAGWFCSRPDFRSSLMKRLSPPKPGRGEPRGSGRGFARAVTLDARVKIPEAIVSPTLGEEIVLLNTATGCSYGLGPVGSRAWELLAEGKRLAAVCGRLAREHEVAPERLRRDLLSLVGALAARGLATVAGQ